MALIPTGTAPFPIKSPSVSRSVRGVTVTGRNRVVTAVAPAETPSRLSLENASFYQTISLVIIDVLHPKRADLTPVNLRIALAQILLEFAIATYEVQQHNAH